MRTFHELSSGARSCPTNVVSEGSSSAVQQWRGVKAPRKFACVQRALQEIQKKLTVMQSAKLTIPILLQAFENLKLINQHKETDTISFQKTLSVFSIFIDKWSSRPRRTLYNLSFPPLNVTHRKMTIAVTQSTFMSETTQGVFPSQTFCIVTQSFSLLFPRYSTS